MSHHQEGPTFALNAAIASAFLMEGLHDAGYDPAIQSWKKGCLEMICEFSEYAIIIERYLCNLAPDKDFPGMVHYEVTSPFGKWLGKIVIASGNFPDRGIAIKELARLFGEFFAQGVPGYSTPELRRGICINTAFDAHIALQSVQNGPY